MASRRIVLPGGTGFLGRTLSKRFLVLGYDVVVVSRGTAAPSGARALSWDGETLGEWSEALDGAAAVINLAGRSVDCRYHEQNRREILESRVRSTRVVGDAIAQAKSPPPVWLNASTATIYRHALDRDMDEEMGELGHGFSVGVAREWERTFLEARTPDTRRVALRTSLVLGSEPGGVFQILRRMVRFGLGGTMGPGNQYMSWIHETDFSGIVELLLEREDLEGTINVTAPCPVPNHEFMASFRRACRRPFGLPAAQWMLAIGAALLRTETELLLKSRRVVPRIVLEAGYRFRFPEATAALEELCQRGVKLPEWQRPAEIA